MSRVELKGFGLKGLKAFTASSPPSLKWAIVVLLVLVLLPLVLLVLVLLERKSFYCEQQCSLKWAMHSQPMAAAWIEIHKVD